jgi:ornithine cyclodeaminase
MLVLTAEEVRKALPMRAAIDAMKEAYAALSDGKAEVPLRTRLPVPSHVGLCLFMPAYLAAQGSEALAIKVVSLFPGNPSRGLAYIQAAVLLLESTTGRTLAILEGSSLTAIRTGAAGGAAVELLARPECRVLAIFGAGAQGRTQLEAACTVRDIRSVLVYDADRERAVSFVDAMAGRDSIPTDLRVASSAREAVENADVICTATTSTTPVFADADLKGGTHISAVGAYTPEMQEVPAETIARARVVVDSRSASLAEAGDLIQPMRAGLFDESHIQAELGEIVLGRRPGRQSADEITYFKSVGIAVQDAMAAEVAYQNALSMGLGREVEF